LSIKNKNLNKKERKMGPEANWTFKELIFKLTCCTG
jgi:hypothetical protein